MNTDLESRAIFVSHSRFDRAPALRLVSWLRAAGLRAWISGPELHCPVWQERIFPHIADSGMFLLLVSPNSLRAPGVAAEVGYARAIGKPIVPISLPSAMGRTVRAPRYLTGAR